MDDPTEHDELVTLARDELTEVARQAARDIGRIHRMKLVVGVFFATGAASLAVGIPVGIIIHNNTVATARANALYDCQLNQQLASVLGRFVVSDATLRVKQAHTSVTPRLLRAIESVIPVKTLESVEATSLRLSETAARAWTTTYLPPLHRLVTLDCEAAVNGKRPAAKHHGRPAAKP